MLVELDAAGIFRPLGIFQGLPPMTTNKLRFPETCNSFGVFFAVPPMVSR